MYKKEILDILDNAKDERGAVPMRLVRQAFGKLVQSEKQHGRIFQEIVVEYPSYNTYPEYKGKPYFSIKYMEDGQGYIGYGTYKPEVLSEYLKEYFMPFAQPELIAQDAYVRGFEQGRTQGNVDAKLQQERKTATWIIHKWGDDAQCSNCTKRFRDVYDLDNYDRYCRNCGSKMERLQMSKDLSEDSV